MTSIDSILDSPRHDGQVSSNATEIVEFCWIRMQNSYVFNPVLCVTLNGKILGVWVFVVDVTRWG